MMISDTLCISAVVLSSLALKAAVGRWGYSGENDRPMHGDFEAQRHWMEVTFNLPIGDWYRNTADNNLEYWGLDYPPLTAYVSWACGTVADIFYTNLIILHESRAYEQPAGKFFMRFTVIVADILILTPAIIYSLRAKLRRSKQLSTKQKTLKEDSKQTENDEGLSSILVALLCLLGPASVLVDHGHFQYNGVCIGLALLAGAAILSNRDVIGSILFCLSLNFKQMALYYAPVFFFVLLRKCLDKASWPQKLFHLIKVGSAVIFSFTALWLPFCVYHSESETCISSLLLVLSRQFPFSRGIFEDKVANLWYSMSVIIDFRQYLSIPQMVRISICITLLLISPVAIDLMRRKGSPKRLYLSLVNCSMAFFLASFQVHEKSLLLPLIPSMLLITEQPLLVPWFQILGAFTMFPLLVRDGLRVPYFAVCAIFLSINLLYSESLNQRDHSEKHTSIGKEISKGDIKNKVATIIRLFVILSYTGMFVLHCLEALITPPPRYPDLYPALFALYGTCNLLVVYILGVTWQWSLD